MIISLFSVSEGSSIDHETNTLSIFNILDDIHPVSLPLTIPKIILTIVMAREEGEPETIDGTITVLNNQNTIGTSPAEVDFQGAKRSRLKVVLNGVPVHAPGKLVFRYAATGSLDVDAEHTIMVSEPRVISEQARA